MSTQNSSKILHDQRLILEKKILMRTVDLSSKYNAYHSNNNLKLYKKIHKILAIIHNHRLTNTFNENRRQVFNLVYAIKYYDINRKSNKQNQFH